jgi:predicted ribosomally synthesized peptide with nif11-like leader
MDNKDFEGFLQLVKTDVAIQQELKALEEQPYEAFLSGFVAVGAKHGFTFTNDEVEEIADEMLANKAFKSGELSDEQLESVAGGKGGGAGGVFIGIINTLVDKLTGG